MSLYVGGLTKQISKRNSPTEKNGYASKTELSFKKSEWLKSKDKNAQSY